MTLRAAPDRPAATGRAARLALFLALVAILLWPVAWNGDPLGFPDTSGYYEQGGQVIERLLSAVAPEAEAATEAAAAPAATGAGAEEPRVYTIRSVPFSVMVNLPMRLLGEIGFVLAQAAVTAWLILLAVRDLPPGRAALASLATAGATTLPFYTAQVMADAMAGWLILSVALLALRRWGRWTAGALLLVAFLSVAAHYSHVPLGLALIPALGLVLALQRRWGLAVATQAPLVLALAVNVAVGLAAGSGASIAPSRLPIMLARTLTDGPGRLYLEETCPASGWTLCEIYAEGDFPESIREALWGPDSMLVRATPAQRLAIMEEEIPLVLAVLREHPVEQSRALLENSARQLVLIGMDDVRRTEMEILSPLDIEIAFERLDADAPVRALEWAQWAAVAAGLAGLAVAVARGGPGVRPAAGLLVLGLVVNAAVCGGLSAPADRYQGRVIWTLVLLGLALALRPRPAPEREGWVTDRRGRLVRPGARGGLARPAAGSRPLAGAGRATGRRGAGAR